MHIWNYLNHLEKKLLALQIKSGERIRYRQFGVMITTSYVHKQTYQKVIEDGHPILIISATDIVQTLRKNAITSSNIDEWLISLEESNLQREKRLKEYIY